MFPIVMTRAARRILLPGAILVLLAGPEAVHASTNNFVVPTFRGQAASEFGFWERFTVPYGTPGNLADQPGSTSGAVVTQVLSPSAFATGSGNLYDPAAAMTFTLEDSTPYAIGTVVLQVRTLGSELAYDEVRLEYRDGGGAHSLAPVLRRELDRGTVLGASVSMLWQWDLRGLGVQRYSLTFGTHDSSLSLDAITLDTWSGSLAPVSGQRFEIEMASPSLDRWMYPHNATPGTRPTAPVFGTLGDDAGVDSRHGQFLIGFDLGGQVPGNLGPSHYLIQRCRLSVTVSRDRSFVLDPSTDQPSTYLPTNHPDLTPDPDPGRPIELFGVGFRNGFTTETFREDSPFGDTAAGQRNAFAAGYGVKGTLIDVGNSVGKTNAAFPSFPAQPFAVGTCATVAAGELVPAGSVIDFELNLSDPLVVQYLQEACHTGRLRWMLTSLQTSGFGGQPAWAEFFTRESVLGNPPRLLLSGVAIRPEDADGDQLPDDWEGLCFGSLAGEADADGDGDGLRDREEWEAGTDPKSAAESLAVTWNPLGKGGVGEVRFRCAPSRKYELVASRDLQVWEAVPEAVLGYEPGTSWATFSLPAVPNGAGFFRVRATAVTVVQP